MHTNCYILKEINFNKGLFDSFIDVTFVITMVNSIRNNKIIKEITKIKPTKKVIIVYNKGYKNCKKPDTIKCSMEDIVHAYYTAFEYLKEYSF